MTQVRPIAGQSGKRPPSPPNCKLFEAGSSHCSCSPRAQPNGQGASRHYHDADNHQPISGCKLNGAPSGHLLRAHSKARCRPCNSMVHLGELEHWLFVYFMMHFGLSQLHCYPTPVRSPFSGLITDGTLCGVGAWPGSFCF